jgi:hypothetical protein
MQFLYILNYFSLKSGLTCVPNFFYDSEFDSERASGIMFNRRPPVKMADFQGEITFISVFDGIRDIFGARFIMQLCF